MPSYSTIWKENRLAKPKIESLAEVFHGRTLYTISIPIEDRNTLEQIKKLQSKLPKSILSLSPTRRLHITIKILGFEDKKHTLETITAEQINEVEKLLSEIASSLKNTITIGPINRFQNVIFLELHNTNAIKSAHNKILKIAKTDLGHDGKKFLPHLTLARFTGNNKKEIQNLQLLRNASTISFTPKTIQLSKTWFENGEKKKAIIKKVRIGS